MCLIFITSEPYEFFTTGNLPNYGYLLVVMCIIISNQLLLYFAWEDQRQNSSYFICHKMSSVLYRKYIQHDG